MTTSSSGAIKQHNNNEMTTSSSRAIKQPQLQANNQPRQPKQQQNYNDDIRRNQFESHGRQRHQRNQSIKPEAVQKTISWSNAKEWHNSNKRKEYCKKEAATLAMITTKTIKRPIGIQSSPETTDKQSQTTHRHTATLDATTNLQTPLKASI